MAFMRLWLALLVSVGSHGGARAVTVEDGGYRDLVVAFSPDIEEADRETVLRQAEDLFKNASEFLYTATRETFYFDEVIFLVPASWENDPILGRDSSVGLERYGDADVWVGDDVDLFGGEPYTLQHQGCGQAGLRINLPGKFLREQETRAKAFVHEWVHYRYGVFDENGFPDDPRFPLYYRIPGTDTTAVTGCTDVDVKYDAQTKNGETCQPSVNDSTGLPTSPDCRFVPSSNGDLRVKSSLMYKTLLSEMSTFCDETTHNSDALNKHNTFCNRESTWSVISRNADFSRSGQTVAKKETTIKYVRESKPRVVVAIDESERMTMKGDSGVNNVSIVLAAVDQFFMNDFPKGGEIGFVGYGTTAYATNLRKIVPHDSSVIKNLADSLGEYDSNQLNFISALSKSVELLDRSAEDEMDKTVVLVTGAIIPDEDINALNQTLFSSKIRLIIILFSETPGDVSRMQELASETTGHFYYVPNSVYKEMGPLTTQTMLYGAFRHLVQGSTWERTSRVLIKQKRCPQREIKHEISFDVDSTLSAIEVVATGPSYADSFKPRLNGMLTYSFLKDGENVTNTLPDAVKNEFGKAVVFRLDGSVKGTWKMILTSKKDSVDPFTIMVFGKSNESTITVRSWFNSTGQVMDTEPLVMYAEVRQGNFPIANANVTAVFVNEDNKQVTLRLRDNGFGDPDITNYDGIYSRYVTGLGAGNYFYTVVVNDNNEAAQIITGAGLNAGSTDNDMYCCGSVFPHTGGVQLTGKFSRVTSSDMVTVTPSAKPYRPSQILDLRLISQSGTESNVVLQWTAPGGQLDSGKAAMYQLNYFEDLVNAMHNFDQGKPLIVETRGLVPGPYGTLQTLTVSVPRFETSMTCYFAIRAVDEHNNSGPVSNVVQLWYEVPPPTTVELPTTSADLDGNPSAQQEKTSPSKAHAGIVVGIIFAVFVVVICIIVVFIVLYLRRRNSSKKKDDRTFAATLKTKSLNGIHESPQDDLRTKNYWSISELLDSGHRVQRAAQENGQQPSLPAKDRVSLASTSSVKDSYQGEINSVALEGSPTSERISNNTLDPKRPTDPRRATAV